MSEFNSEDLDEVIRTAESSLVQMLALQLQKTLRQLEHPSCEAAVAYIDGWIPWGGNCDGNDQPVIGVVEVEFRNGCTNKDRACDLYWPHDGCSSDIIAYRVVS